MNGLTYTQVGEMLIPNLTVGNPKEDIGKYGSMRQKYLKEHRRGLYTGMLLSGTLDDHLIETDRKAQERIDSLVEEMSRKDPGPDKAQDQMGWVRHRNQLISQAEEMVLEEMIYS